MRLISHIISLRIFRRPKTRQKWEWILDFHLPGGREKWLQVDANSALCLAVKPSSNLQFDSSFGFFLFSSRPYFQNNSRRRRIGGEAATFITAKKIQRVERGHFSSGKCSCSTHELWPCPSISLAKKKKLRSVRTNAQCFSVTPSDHVQFVPSSHCYQTRTQVFAHSCEMTTPNEYLDIALEWRSRQKKDPQCHSLDSQDIWHLAPLWYSTRCSYVWFCFYLERDACSAHQLELDQKKKIKKSFLAPQLTTNPVLLRSVEQGVFRAKHFQRERVHALIWDTAGPIAMHEHGRPDCCERPKSLFMACSFSLCSTMGVRVFRHPGSCVCSCLKINKIKLARGEA